MQLELAKSLLDLRPEERAIRELIDAVLWLIGWTEPKLREPDTDGRAIRAVYEEFLEHQTVSQADIAIGLYGAGLTRQIVDGLRYGGGASVSRLSKEAGAALSIGRRAASSAGQRFQAYLDRHVGAIEQLEFGPRP
jgi:hypothetical protein